MAKAIVKFDPLPPVTVSKGGAVTIPSWPAWVTSRAGVLERTSDMRGWVLPESWMPTEHMRTVLEAARGNLERALYATPKNDPQQDAAALVIVTKMMKTLAGHRLDETAAEASGEAYMVAIEDLPVWALTEAMRRWYRGECEGGHDYHWRPDPAELRAITVQVLAPVSARLRDVIGLLSAVPIKEYTPEQRAANLDRLSKLIRGTFKDRVDPIDEMRGRTAAAAAQRLAEDKRRALDDLAAHEHAEQSLASAGY